MSPNIAQLPQHILSEILQYAVSRDSPLYQPSVLRISPEFYLAAIPTLYSSPVITSRIDSFFLHGSEGLIEAVRDYRSNAELVRTGHTKVAAFRHVRRLQIILPPKERKTAFTFAWTIAEQAKQSRQIDLAQTSLHQLSPGYMPNLNVLRFGDLEHFSHLAVEEAPKLEFHEFTGSLVSLFLAHNTPSIWCHNHANAFPLYAPFFLFPADPILRPPILHIHTLMLEDFMIMPGGTTYIYIHRHPAGPLQDFGTQPVEIDIRVKWLSHMLRVFNTTSDLRDMHARSKVILAGLVPPSAPHPTTASSENPPAQQQSPAELRLAVDEEIRLGWKIVAAAKIRATSTLAKRGVTYADVTIEVRRVADMPPCPGCGYHLGGRPELVERPGSAAANPGELPEGDG